jgi:multiple sugar transport system substrate-binding protein
VIHTGTTIISIKFILTILILCCSFYNISCTSDDERITITFNVGRDPTGAHYPILNSFQEKYPHIRVRVVESPQNASLQHDLYVTRFAGRDESIDVIALDVIWIAEFARAGWLHPLDIYRDRFPVSDILPGPLEACTYRDTLFAIPWFTDAGLLYYRKDILDSIGLLPPETWDELQAVAERVRTHFPDLQGLLIQGEQYEGLICNVMEFIWSHGGDVWDEYGNFRLSTPENERALQTLVDFIQTTGIIPRGVLTYQEEESRHIFTDGRALFLRNWPYVWELAANPQSGSRVYGNVGISPLPGAELGEHAATLGGWNLGISRYSRHPNESLLLLEHFTEYKQMKQFAIEGGRLPTRKSLYRDEEILERSPHYRDLFEVFLNARPRPVTPHYSQISDIMQVEIHRALLGRISIGDALRSIDSQVEDLFKRYGG